MKRLDHQCHHTESVKQHGEDKRDREQAEDLDEDVYNKIGAHVDGTGSELDAVIFRRDEPTSIIPQRLENHGTVSGPSGFDFFPFWLIVCGIQDISICHNKHRWLGGEPGYKFGRKLGRLPKIGFVEESDEYAFGFVDPALVLRGCHLIPAFAEGRTNGLLGTQQPTEARPGGETDDWTNYYVGIFVDRDILMRHLGIGIGHVGQTNRNVASAESDLEWEDEELENDTEDILMRLAQTFEDEDEEDDEEEEIESEGEDLNREDLGFDDL